MFRLILRIGKKPSGENRISSLQLSYSPTEWQKKGYDITPGKIDWSKSTLLLYQFRYDIPSYPLYMDDTREEDQKVRYYLFDGRLIYEENKNKRTQIFYKEGYEVFRLGGRVNADGFILGPYFNSISKAERRLFLLEREEQIREIKAMEDSNYSLIENAYYGRANF